MTMSALYPSPLFPPIPPQSYAQPQRHKQYKDNWEASEWSRTVACSMLSSLLATFAPRWNQKLANIFFINVYLYILPFAHSTILYAVGGLLDLSGAGTSCIWDVLLRLHVPKSNSRNRISVSCSSIQNSSEFVVIVPKSEVSNTSKLTRCWVSFSQSQDRVINLIAMSALTQF